MAVGCRVFTNRTRGKKLSEVSLEELRPRIATFLRVARMPNHSGVGAYFFGEPVAVSEGW